MVEAKNHAEALIHSTGRSVAELGDKISAADKSAVDAAIAELKTAMEGEDVEAIKEKTNALAQASMKLGEALYKAQGAAGGGAPDGGGASDTDDDVVDADFEEVKDDDKKV